MNDMRRQWLDRIAQLNVSRSRPGGAAPHKPLLLLAGADMIEEGALRTPVSERTPELVFRFPDAECFAWHRSHHRFA